MFARIFPGGRPVWRGARALASLETTGAFPLCPGAEPHKPPTPPFQPQSIPTLPSKLSNKADLLPGFPALKTTRLSKQTTTLHLLLFTPTLTPSTQASTLRLFYDIRISCFLEGHAPLIRTDLTT